MLRSHLKSKAPLVLAALAALSVCGGGGATSFEDINLALLSSYIPDLYPGKVVLHTHAAPDKCGGNLSVTQGRPPELSVWTPSRQLFANDKLWSHVDDEVAGYVGGSEVPADIFGTWTFSDATRWGVWYYVVDFDSPEAAEEAAERLLEPIALACAGRGGEWKIRGIDDHDPTPWTNTDPLFYGVYGGVNYGGRFDVALDRTSRTCLYLNASSLYGSDVAYFYVQTVAPFGSWWVPPSAVAEFGELIEVPGKLPVNELFYRDPHTGEIVDTIGLPEFEWGFSQLTASMEDEKHCSCPYPDYLGNPSRSLIGFHACILAWCTVTVDDLRDTQMSLDRHTVLVTGDDLNAWSVPLPPGLERPLAESKRYEVPLSPELVVALRDTQLEHNLVPFVLRGSYVYYSVWGYCPFDCCTFNAFCEACLGCPENTYYARDSICPGQTDD